MKRVILSVVTLVVALTFFALPAAAFFDVTIDATCDSYTINAEGCLNTPGHPEGALILYSFSIGDVTFVKGMYHVPPSPDGKYYIGDVTIPGGWDETLCGDHTVESTVEIWSMKDGQPLSLSATRTLDIIGIEDCPCECGDCDGKITQLTLRYNGLLENAVIKVEQKKGDVVYEDTVQPGGSFTFIGTDKGTLGTEISVYVNGVLNTKIHTSCSQPIGPGLVSGDFEVIEGYSKNGGLLDPINGIQPKRTVSAPDGFTLSQNYPNPFNPITTISFSLPSSSFVTLKIYNALGEEVMTLVERNEFAGYHSVMWDASEYSSGIYFYKLTAGSYAETKRLMLLK